MKRPPGEVSQVGIPSLSGIGQAGGLGSRLGAGKSSHRPHKFINLGLLALPDRVRHAVLDVVLQEDQPDLINRRFDGSDLGQDVDAVGVLSNHARDSADLPFDASDTGPGAILLSCQSQAQQLSLLTSLVNVCAASLKASAKVRYGAQVSATWSVVSPNWIA